MHARALKALDGNGRDVVPTGKGRQVGPEPNPKLSRHTPWWCRGTPFTDMAFWRRSVQGGLGHPLSLCLQGPCML